MSCQIWFLHVRKTGGTAIRRALAGRAGWVLCEHDVTMPMVPSADIVLFAVRDPVERAVSGFYDRLRRGAPGYQCPWTAEDERIFARYASIEPLLDDLASSLPTSSSTARSALDSLTHTSVRYWYWFHTREFLAANRGRVVWVLATPTLQADFDAAVAWLGLPRIALPTAAAAAHVAPAAHRPVLSAAHRAAMRTHYAADYDCLHAMVDVLDHARMSPALRGMVG